MNKYRIRIRLSNGYQGMAFAYGPWSELRLGANIFGGKVVAYIIEKMTEGEK